MGIQKNQDVYNFFFYIGELELTMKGDPFLSLSLLLLSIWHLDSLFSLVFLSFFFFFFLFFVLTSLSLLQFFTYESLSRRFLFSRYNLLDCSNFYHVWLTCSSHQLSPTSIYLLFYLLILPFHQCFQDNNISFIFFPISKK